MPVTHTCNLGRSNKTAECSACQVTFTTDRNFDRHIRGGQHITPSAAGLELKDNGRWGMPGRLT